MVVKLKLLGMGLVLLAAAVLAFLRGLPWHYLACAALGLSWVGDAMLAHYPPVAKGVPDPFLAGMASFSLAQVAYISALWMSLVAMPQRHMQTPGTVLGLHVIGGALPVYLLAATLFWVLFLLRARQPAAVKGAALVYALLVSAMAAFALSAAFTGVWFVWQLPLGGLLFLVSDGLIAAHVIRGVVADERRYDAMVWATYAPAQLLMLWGIWRLY